MPRYVALLRAINVGGHTVKMGKLKALFESLGLARVQTIIASGNVVFESGSANAPSLTKRIEALLRTSLGFEVATFLRTEAQMAAIAGYQPFAQSKLTAADTLIVAFLTEPAAPAAGQALDALETDTDEFHVHGREVYWLCRTRQSESAFSNAVLEKTLKLRSTMRAMETVRKIAQVAAGAQSGQRELS